MAGAVLDLNDASPQGTGEPAADARAAPGPTAAEVVDALRDQIEDLAVHFLGEPSERGKRAWRFGSKGAFKLELIGPKRGVWYDFSSDTGGGPIELIRRERGGTLADAFDFARAWLNLPDRLAAAPRPFAKPSPKADDPAKFARRIWTEAIAAAGTLAEVYITRHRGIPGPLPALARFHPNLWHSETRSSLPALVLPAFDETGTLRRVQAVYLDRQTGFKAPVKPPKKTFGQEAAHVPVTLPGPPGRRFDVVITEGPEKALALRAVLEDGNIAATLGSGSMDKPEYAPGTRVLIFADNDGPSGPGAVAAHKAAQAHHARGCHVWIATPPAGRKDADQILKVDGPAALRAVVEAAVAFDAAPPPAPPEDTALSAEEAAEALRAAVFGFFNRAKAWFARPTAVAGDSAHGGIDLNDHHPPVEGIRATVGLGKSDAVLECLTDPELADKFINYFAPAHRLNFELLGRVQAKARPGSPRALLVIGREQNHPGTGEPMCRKAELARSIRLLGHNVTETLCARQVKGSPPEYCPHHPEAAGDCPYIQQVMDKNPAVRFMAHVSVFIEHPAEDFAIIDESFWQGALRGCDGGEAGRPYITLQRLEMLRKVPQKKTPRATTAWTSWISPIAARAPSGPAGAWPTSPRKGSPHPTQHTPVGWNIAASSRWTSPRACPRRFKNTGWKFTVPRTRCVSPGSLGFWRTASPPASTPNASNSRSSIRTATATLRTACGCSGLRT